MRAIEVKKDIYWVGALDWDIRDFHGYATPVGSTYNAYLVVDEKPAVFDVVKNGFQDHYFEHISSIMDPEKIEYMIINHVELDHTGALLEAIDRIKPSKIFCSPNGKKGLIQHFHREDLPYEVVKTGDTISLGKRTIKFIETRMLHWPDSMFSYIPEDKLLISQDAFGMHYCTSKRFDDELDWYDLRKQSEIYFANILMPFSVQIQKLLKDVGEMGLEFDMIAPDHGPIWRSGVDKVLECYDKWSKQEVTDKAVVVYDTMWHSTEKMAHAVGEGIIDEGVTVKLLNMAFSHRSEVMSEVLEAGAIVFGSSTLNNGILPRIADILCYMKGLKPVGRIGGVFGSYGWSGESIKLLENSLAEMKIDLVAPGMKANYVPRTEDIKACYEYGRQIAQALKTKLQG